MLSEPSAGCDGAARRDGGGPGLGGPPTRRQQQRDVPTWERALPSSRCPREATQPWHPLPQSPHPPGREGPPAQALTPHVPGLPPPPHEARPRGRAGLCRDSPAPAGRQVRDSRAGPAVSAAGRSARRERRCDGWGRAGKGQGRGRAGTGRVRSAGTVQALLLLSLSCPVANTVKGVVLSKAG